MQIFTRRPALRWVAPLAVVAVVGGTGVLASTASAGPKLEPKTAEQLLIDVQGARVDGLSGTVVQKADLGLPALPAMGGADGSELTSLLSGSHTAKVWLAGEDKARLALVDDDLGETDLIRDGSDLWSWSSEDNEATHRTLPADAAGAHEAPESADAPQTPQEAARAALEAVGPSTVISTDSAVQVAGRPAYELVLTPEDERTLISAVKIAVDSETSAPLRVQVLGDQAQTVAEVGFESVDFAVPDAEQFTFNPPPGAEVTEKGTVEAPEPPSRADRAAAEDKAESVREATEVVGTGWTSVVVTEVPDSATDGQLATFVNTLQPVSGAWGSGRLLAGTAFSAVLTDDGRLAVGAVQPELLYDALAG